MPAPEGRPGIYGGPPKTVVPDVPLKTGFFSGGGLKGLAGGLAEGVIGAIIYDAGRNAIDYFMDKIATGQASNDQEICETGPDDILRRPRG